MLKNVRWILLCNKTHNKYHNTFKTYLHDWLLEEVCLYPFLQADSYFHSCLNACLLKKTLSSAVTWLYFSGKTFSPVCVISVRAFLSLWEIQQHKVRESSTRCSFCKAGEFWWPKLVKFADQRENTNRVTRKVKKSKKKSSRRCVWLLN